MKHVCEYCGAYFRCRYKKRLCKKQDSLGRSLHLCRPCGLSDRLSHTAMATTLKEEMPW